VRAPVGGARPVVALACENVVQTFSRRWGLGRAVDGVSLRVGSGEVFALVGESGSGKTTLARMIARLLRPTSGRVLVGDTDVWRLGGRDLAGFRRRVQIVFQDPGGALDPRRTVLDAVEEPLVLHGLGDRRERRRKAGHLLDLVGLGLKEAGRFPHQLSGGQKQRVFIARVLALEPSLVILDEPVSALDVSVRAQILNLLLDLRRRLGLTYLLISHDLGVVRRVAGRVGVMHRGRLVEEGPVEEVWSTPAHPYTRALLDAAPIPDPRRRPDAPSRPPAELGERGESPGSSSCLYEPNCPKAAAICRRRRPVAPDGRRLVACHKP